MKITIFCTIFLLIGLATGWFYGRRYANLEVYEMGYNLGFQSAIIPNATVIDDEGKKYKITEMKE